MKNIKLLIILFLSFAFSCAEPKDQVDDFYLYPVSIPDPFIMELMTPDEYEKQCIREEWYFCDLNANWRMKITKDL